jgi:ubiquinone/menaquinone biosynthesis C-methylase UbiE
VTGRLPPGDGWRRWNRLRYTLYAPVYDLALARLPLFRRGRRRSLALAAFRPGERVLLVAAGTGLDLAYLPAGVAVVATDVTPAMLARLRARARALGRDVTAEVMDAARLAYPDASFDGVVLHLALAVVPDPVAAVRKAARVLRPGGRVAVFDKFLPDGAGSLRAPPAEVDGGPRRPRQRAHLAARVRSATVAAMCQHASPDRGANALRHAPRPRPAAA